MKEDFQDEKPQALRKNPFRHAVFPHGRHRHQRLRKRKQRKQHPRLHRLGIHSGFQRQRQRPLYIEGSEGVTLTYWIPIDSTAAQHYETLAEHPYFQWLKEQTGVNVEFIHPSYEQMEQQMNLMIASNKYYDMLYTPNYPGGPQAGIDEGCFIDLNPYLDEYMPDYKAALFGKAGGR